LAAVRRATGSPPYSEFSNQLSVMFQIASAGSAPDVPAHLSDRCKRFLARCFVVAPSGRATARELLTDPWILAAALPPLGGVDGPGEARASSHSKAHAHGVARHAGEQFVDAGVEEEEDVAVRLAATA
jgi:serine/threonine protein kinase